MHFSLFFSLLMQNSPFLNELVLLPLVGNAWIKSINTSMCFSNRQKSTITC
jgi:hypothetical protein